MDQKVIDSGLVKIIINKQDTQISLRGEKEMGTKSVLFHRSVAERKSFRFFVSTIALFMGWSLELGMK